MPVCQTEVIWLAKISVARATTFGDFDKAKGDAFSYRWRDGVAIDSKFLELTECDWQSSIVVPAVVRMLDLQAIKNPPGR